MPLDPIRFCSLAALCGVLLTAGAAQAERYDCRLVENCVFGEECRSAPIGIVLDLGDAGWHWSMPGQFGPQPLQALPGSGTAGRPLVLTRLDARSESVAVYSLFEDGSLWTTTHYRYRGEGRASTTRGHCRPA